MIKSDYPKSLPKKTEYTATELGILFRISNKTAAKMLDSGDLPGGYRIPTGRKERRIRHDSLMAFIGAHPEYSFVRSRIVGLEEGSDSTAS